MGERLLFTAPEFVFVFLPLTFAGFWGLSRVSQPAAIGWLVAASIGFYGYWNVAYLALLVPSIILNYAAGRLISGLTGPARQAAAVIAIAGNLSVLLYFKYAGFLVSNLNALGAGLAVPSIVLPLGISFITFQKIAYIADVYRGKAKNHGLLRFALFVSFFPQLIAGPIAHHAEILSQLQRSLRIRAADVAAGLSLFAIGLFKKVMIADRVSWAADAGFGAAAHGSHLTFTSAWAAAFAYTIQLYFDFSGYSDMACGLGLMFGIRLPINFFSPYKAASIIEFWRRWHMTLSRFLRDYLYIPLGGNRRGPWRRCLNLLITMALGGLWHGAGWTFVLWGAYHGTLLLINYAWRAVRPWRPPGSAGGRIAATALTFIAVVVGWVLFRAESIRIALSVLASMADPSSIAAPEAGDAVRIAGALACVWLLPNSYQIFIEARPALGETAATRLKWLCWRPSTAWAAAAACCLAMTMAPTRPRLSFLYFQF